MSVELFQICSNRELTPAEQRKRIKAAIKDGAEVNDADKNGVTPLHFAVRFRMPMAVQTLLEHGANVNQQCKKSESTPLHRAVTSTGAPGTAGMQKEAAEIVAILLDHGADPKIRNKKKQRPIEYVSDPEILSQLDQA